MTNTWRDVADQLTREQIALLDDIERDPSLVWLENTESRLLRMARRMAADNLTDALYADIAPPPGATRAFEWEDRAADMNRYFTGDPRKVDRAGFEPAVVYVGGSQYLDGRVLPVIAVGGLDNDGGFTVEQARQLAAQILNAADQADGWAAGR